MTVQDLDVAALSSEVGPGTCNSCVDGADITVTIELPGGPVVLDSTKLQFDPTHPVFAALGATGISLIWQSPLGPLRADLAQALDALH